MVASRHRPRHLDGAERSVGSPQQQERLGSSAVPGAGPRRLWVGRARGSKRLWAGGGCPRAPPEKGLELDACCGAEGQAGGSPYLLVPGSCRLQGAGTEGAGGQEGV